MKHGLITVLLFVFVFPFADAQTRLPGIFSDRMVLQQQQAVAVWGWDRPRTPVKVTGSWGASATAMADDSGKWTLRLRTPVAGGPYSVSIKGTKELQLKDVLIGEVWFCSGQSNMEMPVKGYPNQPVIGSNETILQSANDKIRLVSSPRTVSITPLEDLSLEWKIAGPATTGNFSATAYYFARKLQSILGVPVGIIQSAWGASTIESWMDKESLAAFPGKKIPDSLPAKEPNRTPTILYNSLLYPYIGYGIKGVLWYQGEANRENAHEYKDLFSAMIRSWRKQWQQGDFPFYYVQIAPFEPGKWNAAYLREAQWLTMKTVPNTGMVVTMDIGEQQVIHPSQKETVGNRLAYWALSKDYQIPGISYSGPLYRDMHITDNGRILLRFDHCEQGLSSFGRPLDHFEIAGADMVFYPAKAMITPSQPQSLTVWNENVKNPVAVRYAFKSWAEGTLFNTAGLPAPSFRTDNW